MNTLNMWLKVHRSFVFWILTGVIASEWVASADSVASAQALSANDADAATEGSGPAIAWGPCERERLRDLGAVCGMLSVPLDHDRPHGEKIQIALSMIEHTVSDEEYQGIMLANPGGPGGSGLGMSALGQYIPNDAGFAYDWIGFDPRGVGSSVPALSCIADYFAGPRPPYIPVSAEIEQTWRKRSETYANACEQNGGALLEHMRTVDVVRDMDAIRAALHARQLNFYGFSYGTYLGQVYATMFPKRVRRMVLDSNVDSTRVFYESNLDQDIAFQQNLELWWAWVAEHDDAYHRGTTQRAVEKAFYADAIALRAAPAGGTVGPDEWLDIFLTAGYSQQSWPGLAELWVGWSDVGDPEPVVAEYESSMSPEDDGGFAVYLAVQCTDAYWPQSWTKWRADNWAVFKQAPFETWGNAWYNAPCLYWPVRASARVEVDGADVAPVLIVGETLDAATPFSGSLEVRRRFPKASLIAGVGGTTHGASLNGNACIDDPVAEYLATGSLPPRHEGDQPDVLCDPLPQPQPQPIEAALYAAEGRQGVRRELLQSLSGRNRRW